MVKPRLAISFDIEATSDTPATGSCIMIGFVGLLETAIPKVGEPWTLFKKQWCIKDYKGRGERCMKEFWAKYPKNLSYIEEHAQDPTLVAKEISDLLANLNQTYEWYFVADPASFDWAWLSHLYDKFGPVDKTYLGYKAICMDGMQKAALALSSRFDGSWLDNLITPPSEFNLKMSHLADDDAEYQAYGFLALLHFFRYNKQREALCIPRPWILRWDKMARNFETVEEALDFIDRGINFELTTFHSKDKDILPLIKEALLKTGCYEAKVGVESQRLVLSYENWMLKY
ncbi:MAG: hypothetical protein WD512_14400 [Candidatus Paceibacterota bacterium]